MIVVSCPKCRQSYSLPPEKEGLRVRCKCGRQFVAEARAARSGRKKDSSGLALGLGIGGFALVVILVLLFSSNDDPPVRETEEDASSKIVRDNSKGAPPLARNGVDRTRIDPLAESFLTALLAGGPFESQRDSMAFDLWYEHERARLAEHGQTLAPWASLPEEEKTRYENELLGRLSNPPGEDDDWSFTSYERFGSGPNVQRELGDHPPEEIHASVHYALRKKGTSEGRHVYVDVVLHPTSREWMVEGLRKRVTQGGSQVYLNLPHPMEVRLGIASGSSGSRGREVDAGKDFGGELAEGGEVVKTQDGAFGFAKTPRPIPHFESTSAADRTRLAELITLMTSEEGLEAVGAVSDVVRFKRAAVPPLLTALHANYQKALQAIAQGKRIDPSYFGTEMTILALRRIKEEIYEDVPKEGSMSIYEWSKRVIEGGYLEEGAKQLRAVVPFWFGWWARNEEVEPTGEIQTIGRRRPGGVRR